MAVGSDREGVGSHESAPFLLPQHRRPRRTAHGNSAAPRLLGECGAFGLGRSTVGTLRRFADSTVPVRRYLLSTTTCLRSVVHSLWKKCG